MEKDHQGSNGKVFLQAPQEGTMIEVICIMSHIRKIIPPHHHSSKDVSSVYLTLVADADNGNSVEKLDQLLRHLQRQNCKAFASGKPKTYLLHLRPFYHFKESEIEEVCHDLRSLLSNVDNIRFLISDVDNLLSLL
ncbi:hypothetical protein ACLB2K_016441 [Fragaria x ananassa]